MLKYYPLLIILGVLAAYGGLIARSSDASTETTVEVAIDVDVTGNGDNILGPTEACNASPLQVGDTIDVDVVVRGVPEFVDHGNEVWEGGIVGYAFNLLFDPTVLRVEKAQTFDGPTILKGGGDPVPFVWIDYNWPSDGQSPPPGTTGDIEVSAADLTTNYEDGDGVLTRISLTAVGPGQSGLQIRDEMRRDVLPTVADSNSAPYGVTASDAVLNVGGGGCQGPTPSLYPTPTRAPTPTPGVPAELQLEPSTIVLGQTTRVTLMAVSPQPVTITAYTIELELDTNAVAISDCWTRCFFDQQHGRMMIWDGFDQGAVSATRKELASFLVTPSSIDGEALRLTSASLRSGQNLVPNLTRAGTNLLTVRSPSPTPTWNDPGYAFDLGLAQAPTAASLPNAGGPKGSAGWLWKQGRMLPAGIALSSGAFLAVAAAGFALARRRSE
jgi:hypothetical protein